MNTTTTNATLGSYEQAVALIEILVRNLNETLPGGGVTFGYLGNCDINGRNDRRSWMIFLPHPDRVGTHGDRIGSFATNDADGAWRTVNQARGALAMAKYLQNR